MTQMRSGFHICVLFIVLAHGIYKIRADDPFTVVKEYFSVDGDVLSKKNITTLIRTVLFRVKCESSPTHCQTCLPTSSVLSYLNRTDEDSLDNEGFLKLSVILGVFMRNVTGECRESAKNIGVNGRSYEEFLETFVADEHEAGHEEHVELNLHVLEDILHEIEENYRSGSLVLDDTGLIVPEKSGAINYLVDIKCFSPQSLFDELGKSTTEELAHEDVEQVAGLIVAKLLMGHCVRTENLPPKESFMANLFATYADRSTGSIDLETFEKIMSKMGIDQTDDHEDGHGDNGGHDHADVHIQKRRKRDLISRETSRDILGGHKRGGRLKRSAGKHHSSYFDVTENCYSGEQLFEIFANNSSSMDVKMFKDICPAIIQQVLNSSCADEHHEEIVRTSTSAEAYGYGTLAVAIITSCSVVGVFYVKIPDRPVKEHVLVLMMSLAIGTLAGDATLHLIPEATGLHDHQHHDHGHEKLDLNNLEIAPYVWPMMAVMGALYAFFLLELIMTKYAGGHGHSHGDHDDTEQKYDSEHKDHFVLNDVNGEIAGEKAHVEIQPKPKHKNRALAVMIILGDAIHNFADGLAVGAAFAVSITGGISTSLAIFCHELPHELGDFAALISSGLSVKRALFMNVVSGMTAFLGLYVGIAVVDGVSGTEWIFASAAGMFIYVALADIVPEVSRHYKMSTHGGSMFVCINIGLLLGFGSMFVIAVFEEFIRVD